MEDLSISNSRYPEIPVAQQDKTFKVFFEDYRKPTNSLESHQIEASDTDKLVQPRLTQEQKDRANRIAQQIAPSKKSLSNNTNPARAASGKTQLKLFR